MQTLYIKLKLIEGNFAELRYTLGQPAKYETQKLNLSAIQELIRQAKGSYYMLLPDLKGMGQQLFFWLDGHGRWLSRAISNCPEEGLNEAQQRFIFVLDDFEANLELRPDGVQILKPEAVEVLISLLKAISQSRLPL